MLEDLEVDLAGIQPPPQQPLLVPPQPTSPSFSTLSKTWQGQHTWHRKSRCQHCRLLLELLLLKLQLLKLLLLQLLAGSWVPPSIERKVLLGFNNTRAWVCTVFHGRRFLRRKISKSPLSKCAMSKYATVVCFLPVTHCQLVA